jgi:hypothetical protein
MMPTNLLSWMFVLLGLLLLTVTVFILRRIVRFGWRGGLRFSQPDDSAFSRVQFYERLLTVMAHHGFKRDNHLTPLEFARQIGSRDAAQVTRAYNRVRFGNEEISTIEIREINRILQRLENADRAVN